MDIFLLFDHSVFQGFSGACPGIFGQTTKSNGLFQRTSNGLTAMEFQWTEPTEVQWTQPTEVQWTASMQGSLLVLTMKKDNNNNNTQLTN